MSSGSSRLRSQSGFPVEAVVLHGARYYCLVVMLLGQVILSASELEAAPQTGKKPIAAPPAGKAPSVAPSSSVGQSKEMPPVAPSASVEKSKTVSSVDSEKQNNNIRISRPGADNAATRINRPGQEHSSAAPVSSPATSTVTSPVSGEENTKSPPPLKALPLPAVGDEPPLAPSRVTERNDSDFSRSADRVDNYPAVGKLEETTLGKANPGADIDERLANLENAVFAKTFEYDSLFDRTERLKRTIFGGDPLAPSYPSGAQSPLQGSPDGFDNIYREPPADMMGGPFAGNAIPESELEYLIEMSRAPENQNEESPEILQSFALELVNFERAKRALELLQTEDLITRMADAHVKDLLERRTLSHSCANGNNPDRRYTLLGGVDAVTESIIAVNSSELGSSKLSKASVALFLKKMLQRQDDRESLLSPAATHLGCSFGALSSGTYQIACLEVSTSRSNVEPLPARVKPGEFVEIKGKIHKPYRFYRISIAWEGLADNPEIIDEIENMEEAIPFFPPLDYIAYREKSERDHTRTINTLKTVGLLAAIAGGMFVPPVALAAPLIVMAGPNTSEIKPMSDIPVKGGVKSDGYSFSKRLKLLSEGKEGLYFVTVWAYLGENSKPVPVSRRAILVSSKPVTDSQVSGDVQVSEQSDENKVTESEDKESEASNEILDSCEERESGL